MARRVQLNLPNFRQLRKSEKVRRFVHELAEEMAADAGVDAVQTEHPRNRARSAIVGPKRKEAAMLRALGSRMGRSS